MKQTLAALAVFLMALTASCVSPSSILPTDDAGIYALALDYDVWSRANADRDDASYVSEVLVPRAVDQLGIPLDAEDRAQALRDYSSAFEPTQRSNTLAVVFMARVPEVRERAEAEGLTFEDISRIIEALLSVPQALADPANQ